MELYNRIKQRREELGMSQEELALKMGYKSRSSINKIELGKSDIPQSKINAFAQALNTTATYLLGVEDILESWDEKYDTQVSAHNGDKLSSRDEKDKLSSRDEKDISKRLGAILADLDEGALMFDGEVLDDETSELLKQSLENSLRIGKALAKQKFTPNKYKK